MHMHTNLLHWIIKTIISFQGGNNEAVRELEHQQNMEDNYNFVWGKDKKTKQQSTNDDNKNLFDNL